MSESAAKTDPRKEKACWDRLFLRASTDTAFREKLLAEPNETLLSYGIDLGPQVKITVHEFDPNHPHIFLPPLHSSVAKPAVTRLIQRDNTNEGGTNG